MSVEEYKPSPFEHTTTPTTVLFRVSVAESAGWNILPPSRKNTTRLEVHSALYASTQEDFVTNGHNVQQNFAKLFCTGVDRNAAPTLSEYVQSKIDILKTVPSYAKYRFEATDDSSLVHALGTFNTSIAKSDQSGNKAEVGFLVLGTALEERLTPKWPSIYVRPYPDSQVLTQRQDLLDTFANAFIGEQCETGDISTCLAEDMKKLYVGCQVHSMDEKHLDRFEQLGFFRKYTPRPTEIAPDTAKSGRKGNDLPVAEGSGRVRTADELNEGRNADRNGDTVARGKLK